VTTISRIIRALILIPLAVLIIGVAVANRQVVTVSFDPFDQASPAYALSLPLFVLIIVLLILGVVIGGVATWLGQNKWRRAASRYEAEARRLRMERDAARGRETPVPRSAAPRPQKSPPLTIPPPAA